jgi:branched-subunit amino acid aminotransferase/4-amino-4-deoxychorismate lyase
MSTAKMRLLLLVSAWIAVFEISAWIPPIMAANQRRAFQTAGHLTMLQAWSQYAEFVQQANSSESEGEGSSSCRLHECTNQQMTTGSYDLSSPREWLEYMELDGGEGAYTVLRCDYDIQKQKWNVWGNDFHIQRLIESYQCLGVAESMDHYSIECQHGAVQESMEIMSNLLEQAGDALSKKYSNIEDGASYTLMMTLLWQPDESCIVVHGHAFSSGIASVASNYNPDPMMATVAVSPNRQMSLPNRYNKFPQAKLSSWCRRRRPLEKEFKVEGSGEVLLVREAVDDDLHLLEGLTSNLFVVYPGGRLRTADTLSVLGGYARQLVLDCASKCGLEVEIGHIPLQDAGLWEEIFVTSSVRLVVPVSQLKIPPSLLDDTMEFKNLWSLKTDNDGRYWRKIYEEILRSTPTLSF